MIELRNISKTYKSKNNINTEALKDISIKFKEKGLVFILGESGSGKSTLLNIIGGLDKQNFGELIINEHSTKDFKDKDFDAYRNTYVGFVFQDFNLLENYSVERNIGISLELQNKKVTKENINETLKIVGLEGFAKRKINELSGGQKQRVAIARALIKNPEVIIADEPTGNLDSENSIKIFELLKELSKEKLVIVVSHDNDAANKYADRIINIKDGKIIDDTKIVDNVNIKSDFKLISSKFPFKYILKMGIENLLNNKIILFFTILLVSLSFILLGVMFSANSLDINEEHINALVNNNEYEVGVTKHDRIVNYEGLANHLLDVNQQIYNDIVGNILELKEDDEIEAENKTGVKWYREQQLIQNSNVLQVDFVNKNPLDVLYYEYINPIYFIEIDSQDNIGNIIGKIPEKENEVIVSKYIADHIIKRGVYLTSKDSKGNNEKYNPKSYSQILNEKREIKITELDKAIKIVGIMDIDLSNVEILKNVTWDDYYYYYDNEIMEAYSIFTSESPKYARIYGTEDFIGYLQLKENNTTNSISKICVDEKYSIINKISYIVDNVEAYDGNKIQKYTTLNDDEIIIDKNVLNYVTNGEYLEKLERYIQEYDFYDENYIEQFTKNYIKENNIIGKEIKSSVTKGKILKSNSNYKEYKIKAVILNDTNESIIYYSNNILEGIVKSNIISESMFALASNEYDLKNIFNYYPINNSNYISQTKYSASLISSIISTNSIKIIGKYGSIFALVLGLFILINFIISSINYRKKQIGILRAIGTKGKDVLKIFICESAILIGFCFIIADFIINKLVMICNNFISSNLVNEIKFLNYGYSQRIALIFIVLVITFILDIVSIKKIVKMRPVDIILNK